MGFTDAGFRDFLNSLPPDGKVKYINKSMEDSSPLILYSRRGVYSQFASDPNPEVAVAAKEALSKVPSADELENLKKENDAKLLGAMKQEP
jgi:hypothetical protein